MGTRCGYAPYPQRIGKKSVGTRSVGVGTAVTSVGTPVPTVGTCGYAFRGVGTQNQDKILNFLRIRSTLPSIVQM